MTYHTHSAFGILFILVIIKVITTLKLHAFFDLHFFSMLYNTNPVTLYTATTLGALIPDIDHLRSRISNKLKPLSWLIKLFGIKHRGFTHSLLGVIVFAFFIDKLLALGWINQGWYYGLLFGYISHLIIDMFNPQGIALFFPNDRKIKLGTNINTSSWQEHLLFTIITFILLTILAIKKGYYTPPSFF